MTVTNVLLKEKRIINIGDLKIGDGLPPVYIAGPCAVESRDHIIETALALKEIGANILRGGAFKPRTSPYSFQGLGSKALEYLVEAKKASGLPIITELMDEDHLDEMIECVDIIQIGARNMYNYPLLKKLGSIDKPILLKRGLSATIKEWIMSAEYIASNGNTNIIMCERGIRTYNDYTRNTLDLAAVPIVKKLTGLPVIVDPSHGTGVRELVIPMAKAALACGADGLIIEVHPNPDSAKCDGHQSLNFKQYEYLRCMD